MTRQHNHQCTETSDIWSSYRRVIHSGAIPSIKRWKQLIHRANRSQGTLSGNFFDYFDL